MMIKSTMAALAVTAVSGSAMTILINPSNADGSFEAAPGADNIASATWSDLGSTPFWSLNRNLGPNSLGPQDGSFTGVANPGANAALQSANVAATVAAGDEFDFSIFFGTSTANASAIAVSLIFDGGTANEQVVSLTGTNAPIAGWTGALNGVGRVSLPAGSNTAWTQQTFSHTYAGSGASTVGVAFGITTGGGQTYFDNLTLTQTSVPEPSTALLGGLGLLGLLRRRR